MEFNLKKWVQLINYFAQLEKEKNNKPYIDKLKVLKLAWISDRLHLRRYWKLIIGDTYFAMQMWPVASWIKNICEQNNNYLSSKAINYISEYLQKFLFKIRSVKETDFSQFSDSNIEVINEVFEKLWSNNSSKLINFTHNYPEWTKFETKLKKGIISQAQMSYFDFFENTLEQDNIFDISIEHINLTKEIFKENLRFDRLFS